MRLKTKALVLLVLFLVMALSFRSFAAPEGPDTINRGPSERKPDQSPIAVQAQAGNVTPLSITATAVTRRWQGFYGNISGNVMLDDAQGNSLYQWQLASPRGEIYAVNTSVAPVWNQVMCFNFTADTNQNVTLAELESSLGMGTNDVDGVNETFNQTFTGSFTVGTKSITATSGCSVVSLNVNDASSSSFNETILTDNTSNENVIFAALLEQDQQNFKTGGETSDFQMIVGENGDSVIPTNYWFYVELT